MQEKQKTLHERNEELANRILANPTMKAAETSMSKKVEAPVEPKQERPANKKKV